MYTFSEWLSGSAQGYKPSLNHLKPSIPLLVSACSFHSSKGRNFVLLQKLQPITSGAPAQPHIPLVKGCCHLPGLCPTHRAFMKSLMSVIQLRSPEKPLRSKWEVTGSWERSRETWQDCCCMWQRGLELPVSEGYREERENLEKWHSESSSHPAAGMANWRQTHEFYWVLPSSSAWPTHHPEYTWQRITLLGAGGCPQAPAGDLCPKTAAGVGSFCRWKQGLG